MSSGKPGETDRTTGTMYATADKLATVWKQGKEKPSGAHMIFDAEKQTLWMIDDKDKSYTIIDKATLDQMAKQMDQASAQMQEMMAKLPPEQRRMMEKQMAKLKGDAGPEQGERKVTQDGRVDDVATFAVRERHREPMVGRGRDRRGADPQRADGRRQGRARDAHRVDHS